jgi:nucleotide-binding universal stress UspA family protein
MPSGVVVGYDPLPSGERALAEAAAEADRRGVELTVVHALPVPHTIPLPHSLAYALTGAPATPPTETPAREGPRQNVAEEGADRARAGHPGLTVFARELEGAAPEVLAGQSSGADLMVMGHRGREGFLHPSSVALRTVARAECPSVVVRGSEHPIRGTVVVDVDVGEDPEELLKFAYTEAASRGARVKAVSAPGVLWPRVYVGDGGPGRPPSPAAERAEQALERVLEPWPSRYPDVVTDHELIEGSPEAYLAGAATYADLVVVGARRRADGKQGMRVGPVAQTLLLHADCPVAVVPHD